MIIGYARVSTSEQNLDLQRDALKRAGCEKIIEDTARPAAAKHEILNPKSQAVVKSSRDAKILNVSRTVSGGKVQRPGLERVHDALRSGDVLAVWRLDRLGASLRI
jgi:DNA invertase Pin-like site-specific DNA recombinase